MREDVEKNKNKSTAKTEIRLILDIERSVNREGNILGEQKIENRNGWQRVKQAELCFRTYSRLDRGNLDKRQVYLVKEDKAILYNLLQV